MVTTKYESVLHYPAQIQMRLSIFPTKSKFLAVAVEKLGLDALICCL